MLLKIFHQSGKWHATLWASSQSRRRNKRGLLFFYLPAEDEENVVGENGEVEEEDAENDSPCNGETLVETEEDKAQYG